MRALISFSNCAFAVDPPLLGDETSPAAFAAILFILSLSVLNPAPLVPVAPALVAAAVDDFAADCILASRSRYTSVALFSIVGIGDGSIVLAPGVVADAARARAASTFAKPRLMYVWNAADVRARCGEMSTSACALQKSNSSSNPFAVLSFSPIFLKMPASVVFKSAETGVAGRMSTSIISTSPSPTGVRAPVPGVEGRVVVRFTADPPGVVGCAVVASGGDVFAGAGDSFGGVVTVASSAAGVAGSVAGSIVRTLGVADFAGGGDGGAGVSGCSASTASGSGSGSASSSASTASGSGSGSASSSASTGFGSGSGSRGIPGALGIDCKFRSMYA